MATLDRRIGALETRRWRKVSAAELTDAQLYAVIGFPTGYIPTDDELSAIASAGGRDRLVTINRVLAATAGKGTA